MPRSARLAPGGMLFHVINRGVGGMRLFGKDADYKAFELVLEQTLTDRPMRICAYCVMPNHWHLLLWPERDGDMARFMQRLTITHARRWQEHRRRVGLGHVYQGRYKSFPIQADEHFLQVARYVERNAVRANLVKGAEQWRWCSMWRREQGGPDHQKLLSDWPVPLPPNWQKWVNQAQSEREVEALRYCVRRGQPYGGDFWVRQTARRLGLESTLHAPHRPRKKA